MKRVHLWADSSSKTDEIILRAAAISLASYACDGTNGRNLNDPVFEEVTERRAHAQNYSSCGDLPAWVLKNLGCRDEKLVNRNDDEGQNPWKVGKNISMLVSGSGAAWTNYTLDQIPPPGSIMYIGNDDASTHVFVVDSFDLNNGILQSWDYGQWVRGAPGGCHRTRKLTNKNGIAFADTRRVHGFISIEKIYYAESARTPDDFTLGVLDENPY